ncbi:hypothetical protein [Pedobacter cryoconitis]|uniref:hypothetical protein n=1 Tax=Pedobacter cryoconitis TaxID=188932 RepID=UPI001622961D|nr:hypothetical protein [Pedobacter cryoconitis]MBB5643765.1 hypothetical protein [Pedobacter cryoconitis]
MKKVINLLVILIICVFHNCKAQESYIKCDKKTLSIKNFVVDSMFSFNNRYVKYTAIKSIKESKFPLEIRVYSTWISSDIIDLMILQATADSAYITYKKIRIAGKTGIPKYEIVQRKNNYTVNTATIKQKSSKNNYCDFYSQLISNNFFGVKGSSLNEKFLKDPNKNLYDSHANYEFEIKVNEKFRNLEYHSDGNLIDPDQQRGKAMATLIKILSKTLELNENN